MHMTTLQAIRGGKSESLTEAVARRLRGQLAERQIKRNDLVELTGWGRATVYRRLSGKTPLNTDELETLWLLFGISPAYLTTGKYDEQPEPGPDGGGIGMSDPSAAKPDGWAVIKQLRTSGFPPPARRPVAA